MCAGLQIRAVAVKKNGYASDQVYQRDLGFAIRGYSNDQLNMFYDSY